MGADIHGGPYYRARYYDQAAGRFVSEDPIRLRGGINFYAYVKNHPTLLRDPSGRACWGGGVSGSGAFSAFWIGAGAEGSFYFVGDSTGNQGVLDCNGGGFGAISGVGGSVSVQFPGIYSPDCKSICDLEGGFVGATGFAGVGLVGGGNCISLRQQLECNLHWKRGLRSRCRRRTGWDWGQLQTGLEASQLPDVFNAKEMKSELT